MRPSISLALPAPATIVVLSLSMVTFLARPRSSSFTFSGLIPRSSVMASEAEQQVNMAASTKGKPATNQSRSSCQHSQQYYFHRPGKEHIEREENDPFQSSHSI